MKIKKVDDKPMVIHMKQKPKLHTHEPKKASIKAANIYTVERSQKMKGSSNDTTNNMKFRRSTLHSVDKVPKGMIRQYQAALKESKQSIKMKNSSIKVAGAAGAQTALSQMEGGEEVREAANIAYTATRPLTGTASKGAELFRRKALAEKRKRIKKVEAGKKLAKKTAKETAKTAAKEASKKTAKEGAKVAARVGTTVVGTAVGAETGPYAPLIGMVAGKAVGDKLHQMDVKRNSRNRKIKFFLDKMKAEGEQQDSFAKLVKDLIINKLSLPLKKMIVTVGGFLLVLVLLIVITVLPVVASVTILYNSPFAFFLPPLESGDTVSTVTSAYVSEFNRDINTLVNEHTGYDTGQIVYVDFEGESAGNFNDIVTIYMVKYGVGDTATVMNDTSKNKLKEVFDDMCSYTTSSGSEAIENEDGSSTTQTVLYVNVKLKNCYDMITEYEIQSDGMREDDEIIDAEYREVVEEEPEEELDEFAIPDEPESYASARKILEKAYAEERELTPEEAALEDRLVTMAEYGAEMEADKSNQTEKQQKILDNKRNFHYNLWNLQTGGAKTRYKWNVEAIKLLKQLESEALNVSINEFGTVNLAYMQSIYHPDISDIIKEISEKTEKTEEEINLSEQLRGDFERQKMVKELEGLIFLNPSAYNPNNSNAGWEAADEYLSGNVRDKLRVAKAMMENVELSKEEKSLFCINVSALEQVQPKDLDASEIDVRIGTTWIEKEDYEQFIYELLGTPRRVQAVRSQYYNSGIQLNLNKVNMEWFIENKSLDKRSVAATKTYGTSRMDAYSIFENTLNLRTVTIKDRIDDGDGKYHYELNKNETMLAREKQNLIKEAFKEWMQIDNDVQRLKLLKASYDSQRYSLQDNFMIRFPKLIKAAEEKLVCVREDMKTRDAALLTSAEFAITVGNVTFTERTDGGASMLEAISKCKTGETSPLGSFKGFELLVEKN